MHLGHSPLSSVQRLNFVRAKEQSQLETSFLKLSRRAGSAVDKHHRFRKLFLQLEDSLHSGATSHPAWQSGAAPDTSTSVFPTLEPCGFPDPFLAFASKENCSFTSITMSNRVPKEVDLQIQYAGVLDTFS